MWVEFGKPLMDRDLKTEIIELLNEHRTMTIATKRRDGWPHATIVSYANEGLVLLCILGRNTQKYLNIMRDPRVSVTIGEDCAEPRQYKALSLGGRATISEAHSEIDRVREIVLSRHPYYKDILPPDPTRIAALSLTAEFVSIIDYSKGIGHSDLVQVAQDDRVEFVESYRHHWAGLHAL